MKMNGKNLSGPRIEIIVLPRQDGDLVFKAESVLDYEPFEKMYPQPNPPERILPGGIKSLNIESPAYKEALEKWGVAKWDWMLLKSLQATDNLEWEKVEIDQPETYSEYKQEMKEAGLSPAEIAMIQGIVIDACGLNHFKVEQATKAFLAGQGQEQDVKSSPSSEQSVMPSGEPASVSV